MFNKITSQGRVDSAHLFHTVSLPRSLGLCVRISVLLSFCLSRYLSLFVYLRHSLSLALCSVSLWFRVGLKTQPESKCPELLANYCDMLLRKTPLSKKLTSEEIEAKLKEVVSGVMRKIQLEDGGNTPPSSKLLPSLWSDILLPSPKITQKTL